jgi:hypothetical protein
VTLPVVWLPEADFELQEARAWYDDIRPELGERFARAINNTVRFPYAIIFEIQEHRVLIIACFHGRRNPKRWQRR